MTFYRKYFSKKELQISNEKYKFPALTETSNFLFSQNIVDNFDVKVSKLGNTRCRVIFSKRDNSVYYDDSISASSVGKSNYNFEFNISSESKKGSASEIEKFPHNLVNWFITGSLDSDESLMQFFDKEKIASNTALDAEAKAFLLNVKNSTPDVINIDKVNKIINVLEISTSNNLKASFDQKRSKYENFILRALPILKDKFRGYCFVFYVLCVNSQSVRTNLKLDENKDINFLSMAVAHYLLGVQAMNIALSIFPDARSESKDLELRLDQMLKRTEDFLLLNDQIIRKHCDHAEYRDGKWYQLRFGSGPDLEVPDQMTAQMPFIGRDYIKWCKETPVDENFISNLSNILWLKSNPRKYVPQESFEEWFSALQECKRIDDKSPIQLPMLDTFYNSDETKFPVLQYSQNSIFIIWSLMIAKCNYRLDNLNHDDEFLQRMFTKRTNTENMVKTKKFRMLDYSNDLEIINNLVLHRIGFKKRLREGMIDHQKVKSQQGYSLETPTDDISNYMHIEIVSDLERSTEIPSLGTLRLDNLFQAREINPDLDPHSEKVHQAFLLFERTKLGRKLCNLGKILEECNYQFNYPIGSNRMFLTKIEGEDLFLMIKPNGPTNILNFSTLSKCKNISEKPFKQCYKEGEYYASDFVSLNRDRMGELLYPLEKGFGLLSLCCEIFNKDIIKVLSKPADFPQVISHFSAFLMIFLEAKAQTSENILQIRYAYMKVASGSPLNHPFEICSKFSKIIRSRLLLFLMKNFMTYFTVMIMKPPRLISQKEFDEMPNQEKKTHQEIIDELNKKLEMIENEKIKIGKYPSKGQRNRAKEKVKNEKDKKIASAISEASSELAKMDDKPSNLKMKDSADYFSGLLSYIDGSEIYHYKNAVELSYPGILHNKDEGVQAHGQHKIFSKVAQEEVLFYLADPSLLGIRDPLLDYKLKSHESSFSMIKKSGQLVRKFLDKKFGNYSQRFKTMFLKEIKLNDASVFSTMKASARNPKKDYFEMTDEKISTRRKAAEGVLEDIKNGTFTEYPLLDLYEILEAINREDHIVVNLFKKNQLGGVREIFVLEILCRIAFAFIEKMCTALGKDLFGEYLTKGERKTQDTLEFFKKLRSISKKNNYDSEVIVTNSNDATTWAQKWVMSQFYCFTSQVFDEEYHPILACCFNICTAKKLELPFDLMKQYIEKPEIFSHEGHGMVWGNEVKKQFLGQVDRKTLIREPHMKLMKNITNMMQGIFHFTSSCFHFGYLLLMDQIAKNFVGEISRTYVEGMLSCHSLIKCSSDDSSYTIAFLWNNSGKHFQEEESWSYEDLKENITSKAQKIGLYVSLFNKNLSEYVNIKMSLAKSTMGGLNSIEEFNSVWFVGNTICSPLIKFSFAALKPAPVNNIENRLIQMAESRKQCLANGGTFFHISTLQYLQFRIHYTNMGLNCNRLFNVFVNEILEKPMSALGYFAWEPTFCIGVFGHDLSKYLLLKRNQNANSIEKKMILNNDLQFSSVSQQLATSFTFLLERNSAYKAFLERLQIPANWDDIAYANPEKLFDYSKSKEVVLYEIYDKAQNPNVAETLVYMSLNKTHLPSIYMLDHPVIGVYNKENINKTYEKKSLLKCLSEFIPGEERLSTIDMNLMFPVRKVYESVLEKFSKRYSKFQTIETKYYKTKSIFKQKVTKFDAGAPVSLVDCVRYYWFNFSPSRSILEITSSFAYYKLIFPWLNEDWKVSWSESNVKDINNFFKYIKLYTTTEKTFNAICPFSRESGVVDAIMSLVINNQYPKSLLVRDSETDSFDPFDSQITNLSLILTAPLEDQSKKERFLKTISKMNFDIDESSSSSVLAFFNSSRRLSQVAYVFKKWFEFSLDKKDKKKRIEFIVALKRVKKGKQIMYEQEQYQDDDGNWKGEGIFRVDMDDIKLRFYLMDEYITGIEMNTLEMSNKKVKLIKNIVNTFKITPNLSKNRDAFRTDLFLRLDNEINICNVRDLKSVPLMVPAVSSFPIVESNPESYRLAVENDEAKLVYVQTHYTFFEVLKFRPTSTFFSIDKEEVEISDISDYWIYDEEVPSESLSEYLKDLCWKSNPNNENSYLYQKRLKFYAEALQDRLAYRYPKMIDIKLFDTKVDTDIQFDDSELTDRLNELMNNNNNALTVPDFFDETVELKSNLMSSNFSRIDTTTLFSVKAKMTYYNRFFDDYIKLLYKEKVNLHDIFNTNNPVVISSKFSELEFMYNLSSRQNNNSSKTRVAKKLVDDISKIEEEEDILDSVQENEIINNLIDERLSKELMPMLLSRRPTLEVDLYIEKRRPELRSIILKEIYEKAAEESETEETSEEEKVYHDD